MPVRKFGNCSGKFGGRCQSQSDSDGEESTGTGGGSISVVSSSIFTEPMSAAVPTATVTGTRLMPIDEAHCTHRAFYYNLYSASDKPPNGKLEEDIIDV